MATYDEVFAGLSPHPLVISCLRVERKMIKGGNECNHLCRYIYRSYQCSKDKTPHLNVYSCRLHQMLKIYKAPHLYVQICHVRVVAQILHPVPHRHPTLKVIYQIFQYLSFTNSIIKYLIDCPTLSPTVKLPQDCVICRNLRVKLAIYCVICRNLRVFRCKFYSPKILPV